MKGTKVLKRYITLIEIIIVMTIISIIGGVLAYNVMGSLDKGKIFATEQAMARIEEALLIAGAEKGATLKELTENWKDILKESQFAMGKQKFEQFITDAWGHQFTIEEAKTEGGDETIFVWSTELGKKLKKSKQDYAAEKGIVVQE